MIRIIDAFFGAYFGCGVLITVIMVLWIATVWGHHRGMSLAEVIKSDNSTKLTLSGLGWFLLAVAIWPCITAFGMYACITEDDDLMRMLDKEEEREAENLTRADPG